MLKVFNTLVLFLVGLTLPFGYTNVDLGFIILTPVKLASALLVVLVAAEVAFSPRGEVRIGWRAAWLSMFLFSVALSTAISIFGGLPVGHVTTTTITWVSLVAITGMLGVTLKTERQLNLLLTAYTIGAVYVAVTGFVGQGFTTTSAEGVRIGGEGGNSNEAAFHLVLGVATAFALMHSTARRGMRPIWAGIAVLLLVAVGATLSRSGILALLFMGALWAVRFRRFNVLRAAIPAAIIVAVAVALMPDSVAERLESMSPSKANQDTSIQSRKELIPLALQSFVENPIAGVGISGWLPWAIKHQASHAEVIHNAYVHVAAEQGLLGIIPFTALTLLAWQEFTRTWRFARRNHNDAAVRTLGTQATYLQLGYLGCLVVAQFQPAMRYKGLWLCFALAGAVVQLAGNRARIAKSAQRAERAPAQRTALAS